MPVDERLETAMAGARDFILDRQSPDGAWRDFMTEPGIASAWTTAYIGLCLLTLPAGARSKRWQPALERAARFLVAKMDRFHAWGYNANSPPDADSSAHAILFLRHCEVEVPIEAYARLLTFGRPDGGFATYLMPTANDSWGISHPCVTPVAVHALLTCLEPEDPRLARSYQYMGSTQTPAGVWPSFWWGSCLYSTAVNLEAVVELDLSFDRRALHQELVTRRPEAVFERALQARCLLQLGCCKQVERVIDLLRKSQQGDGGWLPSPILRITKRSCFVPWEDPDPGALTADQERLFTTATVLRSLAAYDCRRRRDLDAAT